MAGPHWFPKDVYRWLADDRVQRMTWEERGFYDHMMCVSWLQDPRGLLPDDHHVLSRVLGVNKKTLSRFLSGIIGECWPEESGHLVNVPLFELGQKLTLTIDKRRQAGREGGLAKARNLLQQMPSKRPSKTPSKRGGELRSKNINQKDQNLKPTPQTPLSPNGDGYEEEFEILWKRHPDRNGRSKKKISLSRYVQARKKANAEQILECHSQFMKCRDWIKDNGQYVPGLQVWIKSEPWKGTKLETPEDSWKRIIAEVEGEEHGDN